MSTALESEPGPRPTRRQLLAAAGAGATTGCLDRVRSVANRSRHAPVSVSIRTVPADDDPYGIRFAQELAQNLEAAGIGAEVVPMENQEFLRSVLINTDFDVYVARATLQPDPDGLRPLLHSRFIGEPGWQNPFGYANLDTDELLARQRRQANADRYRTVRDLQEGMIVTQPFTTIAVPDEVYAVRSDRVSGWSEFGVTSPLTYLIVEPASDGDVRILISDERPTRNLNPLAVEFRDRGLFTGLIYESLGRRVDGVVRPWLAREWTWEDAGGTEEPLPRATVTLRDGVRWHDGEAVTADDVAFTYRFLADTSLGDSGDAVPAPAYRGRSSLVDRVEAVDRRTVRIEFAPASVAVATRALTLPVLPKHDWEAYSRPASIAGLDVAGDTTEALVRENLDPVGCGPYRVVETVGDTAVVLDGWPERAIPDAGTGADDRFEGAGVDRIELQVVPSEAAGVELLRSGQADAIASTLTPDDIATVGRADGINLRVRRSDTFYHFGYNNRRPPFSNPRFRRAVARLIDREWLVGEVFSGFASAAKTPLSAGPWAADDRLPDHPFLGSEGRVDAADARDAFRRIGYRYGDGGNLLTN